MGTSFLKISRNSLYMYAAYAVRKGSVLLLAVIVARKIGVAEFGLYCLALLLIELAIRLSIFGTDILIIRDVSVGRPESSQLAGNALGFRLVTGVLSYPVLIVISAHISDSPLLPEMIAIMGAGMVTHTTADLYLSMVQGRERIDLFALIQGVTSLIGLGLALAALKAGFGLIGIASAYALRHCFELIIAIVISRRLGIWIKASFKIGPIVKMLKEAAPIGLNRFLTIVYLGSGLVILEYFQGAESVGYFAGSMKIFEACGAIGMLTMVAAFPTISRLHSFHKEELRTAVRSIIRFFCWMGIPFSIVIALNSKILLSRLFGAEFFPYGTALVFLMLAIPFSLNSGLFERLAYAAHDQKRVLIIKAIGTLLNIIIILALVARMDYLAPAIAILAAEIIMFLLLLLGSKKYVPKLHFWAIVLTPSVTTVIAASPIIFWGDKFYGYNSALFLLIFLILSLGKKVFTLIRESR